jgi:hypothetical protein
MSILKSKKIGSMRHFYQRKLEPVINNHNGNHEEYMQEIKNWW